MEPWSVTSEAADESFPGGKGRFFRAIDWQAAVLCFVVAMAVYIYTLAPTVTLEDSGEMAVAADYLGVPHPPGYPIWTLLAWLFQWVFHAVTYHGYPNPAWAVSLSSAFFGAFSAGVLALLISRSGSHMLAQLQRETQALGRRREDLLSGAAGITAGLLFAFSPVLWSQSTIVEVYSLNAFFLTSLLALLYVWIHRPRHTNLLYLTAFLFGLGLTNHQSLLFLGLALAVAIALVNLRLFRDFMALGLIFLLAVGVNKWLSGVGAAGSEMGLADLQWTRGPAHPGFWLWTLAAVLAPALVALERRGKTMLLSAGALLGCLFFCHQLTTVGDGAAWSLAGGGDVAARWLWGGLATAALGLALLVPRRVGGMLLVGAYLLFVTLAVLWARVAGHPVFDLTLGLTSVGFSLWSFITSLLALLYVLRLPNGRAVGLTLLMAELGVSFYLMMPLASEQNPPMNWGYARTMDGFLHAIGRGQYERIDPVVNLGKVFRDPLFFAAQIHAIVLNPRGFISVVSQYAVPIRLGGNQPNVMQLVATNLLRMPIALLALVPFAFLHRVQRKQAIWLWTTFAGFLAMTVIFIIFQYPQLDVQWLFVGRVQYIQAYAIFAMWIGYGLLLGLAALQTRLAGRSGAFRVALCLVLLLPVLPLLRNAFDQELLQAAGSCDQRGHDFGWQFGAYALLGEEAILEDLSEEERLAYPTPGYPPPMGRNAILFGGTDPGRFVPTYMVFSAKMRPDIYVLTQNALADDKYLNGMRDLYGDRIYLPSDADSQVAFMRFMDAHPDGPGGFSDGGGVQVQGTDNIMQINAILARMIFEGNKFTQEPDVMEALRAGEDVERLFGVDTVELSGRAYPVRDMYVEESYPIDWMVDYLEPHGLYMKLHPRPVKWTAEIIDQDMRFWAWYTERLTGNPAYRRDIVAQRAFSKLRTSLGGLYLARGFKMEAEEVFRQAVVLCPINGEARFRVADLLAQRGELAGALATMESLLDYDPDNRLVWETISNLREMLILDQRRVELEALLADGGSADEAMELAAIYHVLRQKEPFEQLTAKMVISPDMTPTVLLRLAALYGRADMPEHMSVALRQYLARRPNDAQVWAALCTVLVSLDRTDEAMAAAEKAIASGGTAVANVMRSDERLAPLRARPDFQRLLNEARDLPPVPGPR